MPHWGRSSLLPDHSLAAKARVAGADVFDAIGLLLMPCRPNPNQRHKLAGLGVVGVNITRGNVVHPGVQAEQALAQRDRDRWMRLQRFDLHEYVLFDRDVEQVVAAEMLVEVVTRIRARSGLMMVGLGDRQDEREA